MAILSTLAAGAGLASAGLGIYNQLTSGDTAERSPASSQRAQLLDEIRRQYNQAQGQSPTESAAYQTSVSQLEEQNEEQAERDAAQAAARGLEGSQFEVAQNAVRARTMAQGQQDALQRAEQTQNRRQQQRLGTLMSGFNQQDANFWRRRRDDQRRRGQILDALGSALQTGAYAYGTRDSGGSSNIPDGRRTGRAQRGRYG